MQSHPKGHACWMDRLEIISGCSFTASHYVRSQEKRSFTLLPLHFWYPMRALQSRAFKKKSPNIRSMRGGGVHLKNITIMDHSRKNYVIERYSCASWASKKSCVESTGHKAKAVAAINGWLWSC